MSIHRSQWVLGTIVITSILAVEGAQPTATEAVQQVASTAGAIAPKANGTPANMQKQNGAATNGQSIQVPAAGADGQSSTANNATAASATMSNKQSVMQPESAAQPRQPFASATSNVTQKSVLTVAQPSSTSLSEDASGVPTGIDTVALEEPQGNWLFKRIWWEKAEGKFDKIRALVSVILETRMQFFEKRVEVDRKLFDPFFFEIGLSQEQLQETVNNLVSRIEMDREEEGSLSEQERLLLDALNEEKQEITQLQKTVELVTKIDRAIDDALTKLMQQINLCRTYENQAWQHFKAIGRELSDLRARELYYVMDTLWRNVNNVHNYISNEFTEYFDELIEKAHAEVDGIKSTIESLKERGINIQEHYRQLSEGLTAQPQEPEEEETEEPEQQGWFSWLLSWIGL